MPESPEENAATPARRPARAKPRPASSGAMASIVAQGQENVEKLEAALEVAADAASVTVLATDYLRPNGRNPRRAISAASVEQMVNGIRQVGEILQPLLVRPVPPDAEGHRYEVVCGSRRLMAARRLGMASVPVRVREMDDDTAARYAVWENLAREDLSPMDLAESINALRAIERLTWEQIGERFGFTRQWAWKQQKMAELPDAVKELVREGKLAPSKAMLVARAENAEDALALAGRAVTSGLSHRALQREMAFSTSAAAYAEDRVREAASRVETPRKHVLTLDLPPTPRAGSTAGAGAGVTGRVARRRADALQGARLLAEAMNAGAVDAELARRLRPLAESLLNLAAETPPPAPPPPAPQGGRPPAPGGAPDAQARAAEPGEVGGEEDPAA